MANNIKYFFYKKRVLPIYLFNPDCAPEVSLEEGINRVMTCQADAASASGLLWHRLDAASAVFLLHYLLTDLNFALQADTGRIFICLHITHHVCGEPTACSFI